MNREILFRGKCIISGLWNTGSLVKFNDDYNNEEYLIVQEDKGYVIVDPSTVGQYTGLTDCNGIKIFEGDIVKTKKYGKVVGRSNVNDYDVFVVKYKPAMFRLENHNRGFNFVDDGYSKFEVIGNIHDNPDLIGGGVSD